MELTFINPGIDYMIPAILAFQNEDESDFWSEPLYRFYPQLDKHHAMALPVEERKAYIESTLRAVYPTLEETINERLTRYRRHWATCKPQITEALSDAFSIDCAEILNDMRAFVTMNPIEPRFPLEHRFDIFYLNSERGAIGEAIHEMIHLVWFQVWNRLFGDSYDEYERPSMKWILSEMVVEPIMADPRLSEINPYYPRENGGCIYPWFFDMKAGGKLILDTMDEMYKSQSIADFMKNSYAYCLTHEQEIREHIRIAEGQR
ncbi:MAG: hypothetical protein E7459_05835 [Ruminococcaceae bacterium]|nr:hypothetical protein [Oscillospiraceae bacterium]